MRFAFYASHNHMNIVYIQIGICGDGLSESSESIVSYIDIEFYYLRLLKYIVIAYSVTTAKRSI